MKTNLDGLFKNNQSFEKDGVWFMINETTGFLIRRFGGMNSTQIKKALAKHYKPYASQIQNDTLSDEKSREIMTRIFVESSLVDWKGVEIDGSDTPFSVEMATKFLTNLPDLCDALRDYASDSKNYREDLGNS
jgi:hypothetical protein